MQFQRSRALTAAMGATLLLFLPACDPNAGSGAADTSPPCEEDRHAEAYEAGMTEGGSNEQISLRIDASDPTPPGVGANRWTLSALTPTEQEPVPDCSMTATPYMPDHGHGSTNTPTTEPAETDGTYVLDNIQFLMPGYWETTIAVSCPEIDDTIVFRICLEG